MIRAVRWLLLWVSLSLAGCAALPVSPNLPASGSAVAPGSPADSTSQPRRADQAIALVGTVGSMHLMSLAPDGSLRPLAASRLPGEAAWLSVDGSSLVVTTLSGGTYLGTSGTSGTSGGLDWRPAPGDLAGPHLQRAFGSLQAGLVALAEGDPSSGAPGQLVVASLAGAVIARHVLPRAAESAPAWLPDGRIVVVVRDTSDAPTTLIFNPADGRLVAGPAGTGLSVGIGGRTVASLAQDGTVRVASVEDWLQGGPGELLPGPGPGQTVLQVQPSLAGDEVVLVIADAAGDAASIQVLAALGGWHEIARFKLPAGANRAIAGWLVAPWASTLGAPVIRR